MPTRMPIFEAEKYQIDPGKETIYDIYWNKVGTYSDYTELFKILIKNIKDDKDLLYCWKAAVMEMDKEKTNE